MTEGSSQDNSQGQVGEYVLDHEIGKGSFALVYRAHHISKPEQLVAVKSVVRQKLSPKLLENLEGEISILKSMRHTNIVDLRDCIYTDEHIHLMMEYCPGGDLSQYIRMHGNVAPWDGDAGANPLAAAQRSKFPHPEYGGLNEQMVRSFLAQLVSAVRFLRSKDIVHRDIKPQNLLLQIPDDECLASGHPPEIPLIKVADFGFARSLPATSLAKTLCGSPLYMAPEILRYEKYDAKADLWSVGAVLYEMCVGRPPFRASNHVELLRRIEHGNDRIKFPDERSEQSLAKDAMRRKLHGDPPRPNPPEIAPDIKMLIRKLLKRHPVERMSFDELFTDSVVTQVPYTGRAIIKDELAASVHLAQIPPDILSPPKPKPHLGVSVTHVEIKNPQFRAKTDAPRVPSMAIGFNAPTISESKEEVWSAKPSTQPSGLSRAIHLADQGKNASAPVPVLVNDPHVQVSFSPINHRGSTSQMPAWGKPMSAPPQMSQSTRLAQVSSDEALESLLETLAKKAYVLMEFADMRDSELGSAQPTNMQRFSPAEYSPNSAGTYMQEVAGTEVFALYVRALGFLQRGLEAANSFAEQTTLKPSEQLRELTQWFRTRFDECYEKSLQARSRCRPNVIPDTAQHIDRQIFDKALELARLAALEELEENKNGICTWDPTHCLMAYETAASLLQGLLDPSEDRMSLSVHSTSTVEKFLKSITKRLSVLHGADTADTVSSSVS